MAGWPEAPPAWWKMSVDSTDGSEDMLFKAIIQVQEGHLPLAGGALGLCLSPPQDAGVAELLET